MESHKCIILFYVSNFPILSAILFLLTGLLHVPLENKKKHTEYLEDHESHKVLKNISLIIRNKTLHKIPNVMTTNKFPRFN